MRGRLLASFAAGLLEAWLATSAAAAPCDSIGQVLLPADVRLVRTADILPNTYSPATGIAPIPVAFCRVEGMIEREIGFELWLPERGGWSGRFLTGGVGGQAGSFNYRDMARGLRRGYATASTDTGHKASDPHWLLGDPMRAANYAERANHLLAVKAKAFVSAYYRKPIRTALFVGCSGGGRQALTEAQRFPADYDGILAGAPGPKTPEMSARRMWEMIEHSATASAMPDAAWAMLQAAAVAACDEADGLRDGIVENGGACRFDPATIACRQRATTNCLSEAQVAVARRLYGPLVDEKGRRIDDGLLPVVRVHPQMVPEPFTPGPPYLAVALFGDGVHRDVDWDVRRFSLADDLPAIDRVMNLHADDPDIRPFTAHGGRLILYQGWADPLVAAQPTVDYYRAVRRTLGAKSADGAVRLYMVPNMEHCVGGEGATDQFGGAGADAPVVDLQHDMLAALETWVEQHRAPGPIVAARIVAGRTTRTRPLCPYPQQAIYSGTGDSDDAAAFRCGLPPRQAKRG